MKTLTITLWNIQGINSSSLGCKTKTLDIKKSVLDIDIIILQETWRRTDEVSLSPPGYCEISISSQKHANITRGRDSGGTIIWYKIEIAKYIQIIKKEETHIWIKIDNQLKLQKIYSYVLFISLPLNLHIIMKTYLRPSTVKSTTSRPREVCWCVGISMPEQDPCLTTQQTVGIITFLDRAFNKTLNIF